MDTSKARNSPKKNHLKWSFLKGKKIRVTLLTEDIQAYLESECEEELANPVKFWKLHADQFPTLSCMARTVLAVPASSAP